MLTAISNTSTIYNSRSDTRNHFFAVPVMLSTPVVKTESFTHQNELGIPIHYLVMHRIIWFIKSANVVTKFLIFVIKIYLFEIFT